MCSRAAARPLFGRMCSACPTTPSRMTSRIGPCSPSSSTGTWMEKSTLRTARAGRSRSRRQNWRLLGARVKKGKYRVLALGATDLSKLPNAIQKGIWQCIALYTEAPPKGGRDNFGFAAYEKWGKMLTNTRNKQSWERMLAPGEQNVCRPCWIWLSARCIRMGAYIPIQPG